MMVLRIGIRGRRWWIETGGEGATFHDARELAARFIALGNQVYADTHGVSLSSARSLFPPFQCEESVPALFVTGGTIHWYTELLDEANLARCFDRRNAFTVALTLVREELSSW